MYPLNFQKEILEGEDYMLLEKVIFSFCREHEAKKQWSKLFNLLTVVFGL